MTNEQKLTEANAALHALLTGTQVVSLRDQNGETVTYNQASITQLQKYIARLEALISATPMTSLPMGAFF